MDEVDGELGGGVNTRIEVIDGERGSHHRNIGIGTEIGKLEVVPDGPCFGACATDTDSQRVVSHLYIYRINGIHAS